MEQKYSIKQKQKQKAQLNNPLQWFMQISYDVFLLIITSGANS